MTVLESARLLARRGRFAEALQSLQVMRGPQNLTAETLRAELLERLGEYDASMALATRLLTKPMSLSDRSACECTVGLLLWCHLADTERAIELVKASVSTAERSGDIGRVCWSQLRLMAMLADTAGPAAAGDMLNRVRANLCKLGDSVLYAAVHIFVGIADGKRGLTKSVHKHTRLALDLLEREDNLWLRSMAYNAMTCSFIMESEFDAALEAAQLGLDAANLSGARSMIQGLTANIGKLFYLKGDLAPALAHTERGIGILPTTSERNAGLGNIALIRIAERLLPEARQALLLVQDSVKHDADWVLYPNRHSLLVLGELLLREGEVASAHDVLDKVLDLAVKTTDELLRTFAQFGKARAFELQNRLAEAIAALDTVAQCLRGSPPEVFAHYESRLATVAARGNSPRIAISHYKRAKRWYQALHQAPALADLECEFPFRDAEDGSYGEPADPGMVIQDLAGLFLHLGRPDLLAVDLIDVMQKAGCVESALALRRLDDGTIESFPALMAHVSPLPSKASKTLVIGSARGREVEVCFEPKRDLESIATVNAIQSILNAVSDLEQAHAEREARLALWPQDDLPADDDDAVITGQMRELMAFARKVAMTNISVLITGESGTGKEIVARAIHTFSPRAKKPFIPFNCTAVPREMLESQLFGHRRGAFTSADRDSLGMIRAAREGTLFLDEIGELGLDLQPKLLRFLESGEVCPLGEPTPLHVDVRIVAATNQNLDEVVRQGRFREDLFYRLNVVRLTIPPLRERRDELPALVHHFVTRAAADYGKGKVRVAEETMEHLLLYAWPGNVRQLQNEIRRMIALADPDTILSPATLSAEIRQSVAARPVSRGSNRGQIAVPLDERLAPTLARIEREMIRTALHAHNGRLEDAARALGISRKGLYLKRQRLGL